MNLHGIVGPCISIINSPTQVAYQQSTGYTTDSDGTRHPVYAALTHKWLDVQALSEKELGHMNSLNIGGTLRKVYANGQLASVIRNMEYGGDLLSFNSNLWLVVHVMEQWDSWCSVIVQQQSADVQGNESGSGNGTNPSYQLTVTPISTTATFDSDGNLIVSPVILQVQITPQNGYVIGSSPIAVTFPLFAADADWSTFSVTVDGTVLTSDVSTNPYVAANVSPFFNITMTGKQTGWGVNWADVQLSAVDGNGIAALSNEFSVISTTPPPPPETSTYYYLEDRASAVDHSHIFHLLSDLSAVNMWDGVSADILWATLPNAMDPTNDRDAGIIVTAAFVYVFGRVSSAPHIWQRPVDASAGGSDWTDIALPTDTASGSTGYPFFGFPWVAVDMTDIISLIGANNEAFAYWAGANGSWSARLDVYQGDEADASPQPGFIWTNAGRVQLAIFDRYAAHNYYFANGVWNRLDYQPDATSITSLFGLTGSDLLGLDAHSGATGIIPVDGNSWGTEVPTGFADFAPTPGYSTTFSMGYGRAMLVSQVPFQSDSFYGLVTDGSSFALDLYVNPTTGHLTFGSSEVDVNALPAGWVGSPGTGNGEALPDGTFLHSGTFVS